MPPFVRSRPRCHLTLAPETLTVLGELAARAGVAPSRVVDALVLDLTARGASDVVAAIVASREAPR